MTVKAKCDGEKHCDDLADELVSECDNCAADHLFMCKVNGVEVCMNAGFKCDGLYDCDDLADELVSECPNCVDDPSMFTCRAKGKMVCLSKKFECMY